ncbi:MAG: hypothetical protein PVF83_10610 [Anaerolineales bacterium]|jgi:hypothetical protein
MAIYHKAYLLDGKGFIHRISPILDALDNGNPKLLYEDVLSIIENSTEETWFFNELGYESLDNQKITLAGQPLDKIQKIPETSEIHPYDLGFLLMIIFSQYLVYCRGMGENYSILAKVLEKWMKWKETETDMLVTGVHTVKLLKSNIVIPDRFLTPEDPYYFWMRLKYTAGHGGWLSQEQIQIMYDKLLSNERKIKKFNYKKFGNCFDGWRLTVPEGQLDYLDRLHKSYNQAVYMCEKALQEQKELYMIKHY